MYTRRKAVYIERDYNGGEARLEGWAHGFYQRSDGKVAWPVALFEERDTGKIHEVDPNRGELRFSRWVDA